MKLLRRVCTFVEFSDSPPAPSLRDYISDVAQPDEDKIVAYLEQGIGLAGRGGYLRDVLNTSYVGLTGHTLTDGVYVWLSYLPYYVKTYHLRLPSDVITHMRANAWTVPSEDSINIGELSAD
jgi:hypothetical protein